MKTFVVVTLIFSMSAEDWYSWMFRWRTCCVTTPAAGIADAGAAQRRSAARGMAARSMAGGCGGLP